MELGLYVARLVPAAAVLYLCVLGPAQAWWRGTASSLPRLLGRVILSTLWTTLLGLALAGADAFSVPLIALINGTLTLFGYLYVGLPRHQDLRFAIPTGAGLVVCMLAATMYWPTYDVRVAGSDSTTYVTAGTYLSRAHKLWKHDDVGPRLDPTTRRLLFRSVIAYDKAPFSRVPGGLVVASPDAATVRPSFFPAAIVWSAVFSVALGVRHAGGYAVLFSALGIWTVWLVARRRLSAPSSLMVAVLAAANAAAYFVARMPLAEPLAGFFLWAGICALDAWEEDGFPADARIAALCLGAAGLVRIEILAFVLAALALRTAMRPTLLVRPLSPGFWLAMLTMMGLAAAQAGLMWGAYTTPIEEALKGLHFRWQHWQATGGYASSIVAFTVASAGVLALSRAARRFGSRRVLLFTATAGGLMLYWWYLAQARPLRSLTWLGAFLGYAAVVLAPIGAAVAWKQRAVTRNNGFLVLLFAVTAAVLVYNPHVYPTLPWAIRRFSTFLVPAILLFGALAASAAQRRSLLAGLVVWLLLGASVFAPARHIWGREYWDGAGAQLDEFVARLPRDGVFLIHRGLEPFLLGVPMWLVHDLDTVPVDDQRGATRHATVRAIIELQKDRDVYYMQPTLAPWRFGPRTTRELITDYTFQIPLPQQTADSVPRTVERYTQSVSVFKVGVTLAPAANVQR